MVDDNVRPPTGPANSVPIEGSGVAVDPPVAPVPPPPPAPAAPSHGISLTTVAVIGLSIAAIVAIVLSWQTQQRVRQLEQELVRRQQGSTE